MMTLPAAVGELEDSTHLLDDPEALRARGARDGYLFFRGMLPREPVLQVRREILAALAEHGWLEAGSPIEEGRVDDAAINLVPSDKLRVDIGISAEGYADVQKVHNLHRLPHHPAMLQLYRALFGEPVFVHPRHIVRVFTSHRDLLPTPPHQDFPLVQGSQDTWTAWAPLGDAPRTVGCLSVLRRSHRSGVIPLGHLGGTNAHNVGIELCRDEVDWLSTDFRAGDVLTFPAVTIHRALPAVDRTRIRLSMDIRYQPASEPIEEKSLTNHASIPWDEVYAGWSERDIQYYWEGHEPVMSPWDDSLIQLAPVRRIC